MVRPAFTAAVVFLSLAAVGAPATPFSLTAADSPHNATTAGSSGPTEPTIVAVYPNPIAHGDAGEAVVLSMPNGTDIGRFDLGDDEGTANLPNRTVGGRVVVVANRSLVPGALDGQVVECPDCPALANGGERLALSGPSRTVATVAYTDAPEGEVFRPGAARPWQPLGATSFDPVVGGPGAVRAFTLPDAPQVPIALVRSAEHRIELAGYSFSDDRVTTALVAAQRRGVDVTVLVDGAPVGGLTNRSARTLNRLVDANISVLVLGGPAARYRFHHAKYAVVDDRAVVLTENWKPAGVGGTSSRGWGVVVNDSTVVTGLRRTFDADTSWRDTISWETFRRGKSFEPAVARTGRYPTRIEPQSVHVRRTELLVAPDNAAGRVEAILANATDSVQVVQVSIGGRNDRLLEATVGAARRGVEVDILLSAAWYVRDENRALAAYLRTVADREDLPIRVRLADPGGRYEKIHAKGVVVDGDTVVLGSLNWNRNAYQHNREVALVLHGSAAGTYYSDVFDRDWRGGLTRVTVGLLVAVLVAVGLSSRVARRIEFET